MFQGISLIIGSPELSTKGTAGGNLDGRLLGYCLGSIDGIEFGKNVGDDLGLYDGKVFGKKIGALYGISLRIYDGTMPRYLKWSTGVIVKVNFEGLILGAWLGSLDGIELSTYMMETHYDSDNGTHLEQHLDL